MNGFQPLEQERIGRGFAGAEPQCTGRAGHGAVEAALQLFGAGADRGARGRFRLRHALHRRAGRNHLVERGLHFGTLGTQAEQVRLGGLGTLIGFLQCLVQRAELVFQVDLPFCTGAGSGIVALGQRGGGQFGQPLDFVVDARDGLAGLVARSLVLAQFVAGLCDDLVELAQVLLGHRLWGAAFQRADKCVHVGAQQPLDAGSQAIGCHGAWLLSRQEQRGRGDVEMRRNDGPSLRRARAQAE